MRKDYIYKAILLLCVCGLLVLTGCSNKDGQGDSEEMLLRLRLINRIQTLDAGNMRGIYSGRVGAQIYEPLYRYHYLKRPYVAEPLLAEAMPQVSEDRLILTIPLRKGVYYHDDPCFEGGKGREVVAGDIVYALKRIANIRYINQNWANIKERIVGLDEFREYTKQFKNEFEVDYSEAVEGLQALDDYTLQIKVVKPWPQIVDVLLTDNMSAPMPHEAVSHYKKDIMRHPVGSGPFRLKKWQPGVFVELERNPNWAGGVYPAEGEAGDEAAGMLVDAGKPIPIVDRIIWRVVEEQQPAWLLLMNGEIDAISVPKDNFSEAVSIGNMEETKAMRDRGIKLIRFNHPSVFWIGFNLQDPVLGKNKPLRKAISRCFDREKFDEILFNSRNKIAHGFIPPGLNAYDPEIEKYGYSKYDPQESKVLLKEAEKIQGGQIPVLTLAVPGTSNFDKQYGQFAQSQFQAVGLQLEIEYMDWPTYLEKMNNGKLQMFASGISAGSPDAIDFLDAFTTRSFAPGSNVFFYSTPEYDDLFAKVEVMPFDDEVKKQYQKLERMAMEDYPGVFIFHRMSYVLVHDWLENYKPHVFSHSPLGACPYYKVNVEKRNAYKDLLKQLEK